MSLKLRQGRLNNVYKSFFELYEQTFQRRAEILLISGQATNWFFLLLKDSFIDIKYIIYYICHIFFGHFWTHLSHEKHDFRRKFYIWWTGCIKKSHGWNGNLRTKNNLENAYWWFNISFSKYRRFSLLIKSFYYLMVTGMLTYYLMLTGPVPIYSKYSGAKWSSYFYVFIGVSLLWLHTVVRFTIWTDLCWEHDTWSNLKVQLKVKYFSLIICQPKFRSGTSEELGFFRWIHYGWFVTFEG